MGLKKILTPYCHFNFGALLNGYQRESEGSKELKMATTYILLSNNDKVTPQTTFNHILGAAIQYNDLDHQYAIASNKNYKHNKRFKINKLVISLRYFNDVGIFEFMMADETILTATKEAPDGKKTQAKLTVQFANTSREFLEEHDFHIIEVGGFEYLKQNDIGDGAIKGKTLAINLNSNILEKLTITLPSYARLAFLTKDGDVVVVYPCE